MLPMTVHSDLDTHFNDGYFYLPPQTLQAPMIGAGFMWCMCSPGRVDMVVQVVMDAATCNLWVRNKVGSCWCDWMQYYNRAQTHEVVEALLSDLGQ